MFASPVSLAPVRLLHVYVTLQHRTQLLKHETTEGRIIQYVLFIHAHLAPETVSFKETECDQYVYVYLSHDILRPK